LKGAREGREGGLLAVATALPMWVVQAHLIHVNVLPNVSVGHKLDSLFPEEIHAAVNGVLGELQRAWSRGLLVMTGGQAGGRMVAVVAFKSHLHVGDSVHEEATDPILPLEHGHLVPHLVELIGGSKASRATSDHGDAHSSPCLGDSGDNVAILPSLVDDRVFNVLNGNGIINEACNAGTLARGGTHPASEFGKVVR